jgi:hypothetical protein
MDTELSVFLIEKISGINFALSETPDIANIHSGCFWRRHKR